MRTPHPIDASPRTDRRLLDAKLTPPAASHASVSRAVLADTICSTRAPRLVLVRAAAGFGKTTLMLECRSRYEQMGLDTAWLTLDRSDNDASRFLAVLHAALAPVLGVDEDETPRTARDRRQPSEIGMAALDLLNRVAVQGQPFALFLDDFEIIREPGVHSLVRELIDAMPRHSRLVIGSRTLPELRLGRLRAQDQLLEVDASQLRFTIEEAAEFLAMRRMPLDQDDLVRLHRKTEGWAAALRLASIALERSEDRPGFISKFSGSDRAVAEYLAEEVLARQPAAVRDFLQRTSVLRQLEPGICDYVLDRSDSAETLASLERTDALLVRLGEGQHSYRYHSMFASFLRGQMSRSRPDELLRLHRKAAQWYMAQGRPVPAIDHALESGETELAVQLLEGHAATLLAQGRMRILSRWFAALPPAAFDGHPQLVAIRIWALCFTRGSREATALLEESGIESDPDPQLKPHLLALKPLLLAMMDRYEEAYAAGRENLAHLPTGNAFADMVLANAMTTVAAVLGQHHQARRLLDSARRSQGQGGSSFNVMYSEAAEGIINLEEGRLRQATARFRLAMNATVRNAYSQTHGNSWAGVLCAIVCYEGNELDQAAHLLHVYLPIARDVQLTDQVIAGYALLARISFIKGDIDHALQTLAELEYLGHQRQLPRLVVSAQLERARLHLSQGHHDAAREELTRADNRDLWERMGRLRLLANDTEYLTLGQLRWETLAGNANEAARRLDDETARARSDARHRRALKLNLLRAIALHRDNRPANAHDLLREVLKAASLEGYMRLILDEGRPAGALLRSFVGAPGNTLATGDPIFNDYLQRLEQAFGVHMALPEAPAASHSGVIAEPMTRKELRVLQLLAEGYSNNAIAEKLFVSDSTVRTHLRNVNAKLSTHSRTQAVATARRLGLLG